MRFDPLVAQVEHRPPPQNGTAVPTHKATRNGWTQSLEKRFYRSPVRRPDTDTDTDKSDATLLAKFKGQFPPSLQKVMAGEAVAPGKGFHNIALQIAITANALGKKEDEVIAACEGLLETHQSDGNRYNTPTKRRNEILRLMRYTGGQPLLRVQQGCPALDRRPGGGEPRPGRLNRGSRGRSHRCRRERQLGGLAWRGVREREGRVSQER